ncbi:GNAT family N-acetyltransferase [Kineococcus sp. GCM10028916]|uniref:GNAT family N-acetyltransferase n=1 Tax=Kineococcus sp. GCM10028916 TaxID=3273394 RepID=UPI0036305D9B
MTVRLAGPGDWDLLPAVERAADGLFRDLGVELPDDVSSVEELRAAEFVLVAGAPPVGFARVERVDGLAHLQQVSVHPAAARRGVGSSLLAAVLDRAADRGFTGVTLTTFADVAWNGPFYRRRGFTTMSDPGRELLGHVVAEEPLTRFGPREVLVHPIR